jgi:gliding motility-associated-like protein
VICFNSINLYATPVTVGTATWTLVSGGGTIASVNSPTTSVTGLSAGTNVFVWSSSNGVCAVSRDTVKITLNSSSTPAFAGTDQTICSTSYTLNGNVPGSGSGQWSLISGSGSITTPSLHNSAVTGLGTGVNQFAWSINNSCGASSDTVRITVNAQPSISNAGTNQTICAPVYTLAANNPTVGAGSWTVIGGSGTVSSPTQFNSHVTGMSVGANSFVWTISNGVCQPSKDTVTITVNAPPTPANAGPNQVICATNYTLNANSPIVGSGFWSVVAGSGIVVSPSSHNSMVNNLSVGNNILVWTISNGVCPPSSDSVTISATAMPSAASAGSNQSICNDSANLNASPPTVGNGSWSIASGGGAIANPSQANSLVYNLAPGNHVFMWTVTNGVCPASTSTVAVNVSANPSTANAGTNQTICTSTFTLAGNTPAIGNGTWVVVSGGATVNSPASPNSSTSGLTVGQNVFVWSIANGVCPASVDSVIITVASKPSVANAGADQNVCVSSSSALMAATSPTTGAGVWSVVTGSGSFANASQSNTSVSGLSTGQNIFVWTVANSVCPSSTDTVRVIVFPIPTVANAGNDTVVNGGSVTLHGNIPVNGAGSWSLISGAGTLINASSSTTSVTDLGIGDNIFSWTISNGVCPDSRDDVTVHVNDLVIPNGFSPNGDGMNDYFEIPGLTRYKDVKIEVFNRWGNLVYHSEDYRNNWAGDNLGGEMLTDDTYYYVLVIAKKEYKGFVVLKK